jgi:hypothetical protein
LLAFAFGRDSCGLNAWEVAHILHSVPGPVSQRTQIAAESAPHRTRHVQVLTWSRPLSVSWLPSPVRAISPGPETPLLLRDSDYATAKTGTASVFIGTAKDQFSEKGINPLGRFAVSEMRGNSYLPLLEVATSSSQTGNPSTALVATFDNNSDSLPVVSSRGGKS